MTNSKYKGATIVRAPHEDNYFRMKRQTAQDKNLSFEARGMIAYILSKKDGWEMQVHDLQQNCAKGRVYRILDELAEYSYLEKRSKSQIKGRWEWSPYVLHEVPYPQKQDTEKQDTEKQDIKQITELEITELEVPLSAPKEAQGQTAKSEKQKAPDKPKAKKERNRLFDGIAFICFELKDTSKLSKQISARIGKLVKYLKSLEEMATPDELWKFNKWYSLKYDNVTMPRDVEKFATHFELFRQSPVTGKEPQLTVVPKFDITSEDKSAAIDAFKNKPQFGVSS